jgi:hypothetical protein
MVTVNTLFKYAFPTQITQATPDVNLSFLKKVLVIVLDADSTSSEIQEITKLNIPVGYEFLNGGFNSGVETIYLKQVTSLDLTDDVDLSLSFYNVLVLDKAGAVIEDIAIKLNHDGYIAKMVNSDDTTIYSPMYCEILENRNYIGCYNMGILFANNNNYSAKQYITSTDSTVLASAYSDITTLNNMFTNGMFWGYDSDYGVRLYGSFNNGDDILAKHLSTELIYKIKNIHLQYITANTPKKSEVVRAVLENKAIKLILDNYVTTGLIDEDFTYRIFDTGVSFTFNSSFSFTVLESLWKIENTIQIQ